MSTRPGIEITANYSQVKVVTMAKHNSTLSIILPFQVNLRYGYIWSSLFSAVFVLWIFPAVFSTPFFFLFSFSCSWCPSVAIFNCCKVEQSNKAQNARWKAFHASLRHWHLCTQTVFPLLSRISQKLFKPRKSTRKDTDTQKPLIGTRFFLHSLQILRS